MTRFENILTLDADKLALNGTGTDVTVAFTQAASMSNISSGETLSGLFGKIRRWFTDFGVLAWLSKVGADELTDESVTNSKLNSMQRNTLKGNNTASTAQPKDLTAAEVRSLLNISDGADATAGAISGAGAGSIANNDKIPFSSSGTLKSLTYSALKTLFNALYASITHSSSHSKGGADEITPESIGALVPASILNKTLTAAAGSGSQVISDAKIKESSVGDLKIAQCKRRAVCCVGCVPTAGYCTGSAALLLQLAAMFLLLIFLLWWRCAKDTSLWYLGR